MSDDTDPGPGLQAMEGGKPPEGEAPANFEAELAEENRELANIYRANLRSQAAETIKGLLMMHAMAAHGNKDARDVMNGFWELLRSAGVAFPANRKQRRELKALPGGKPRGEESDGGELPAS